MYERFRDSTAFLFVYIREAHPTDEWSMSENEKDGVLFAQPTTTQERRTIATTCCSGMKIAIPTVVDGADNAVEEAYAAWPERMFVINERGVIEYATPQGPWGFSPANVESALERLLADMSRRTALLRGPMVTFP